MQNKYLVNRLLTFSVKIATMFLHRTWYCIHSYEKCYMYVSYIYCVNGNIHRGFFFSCQRANSIKKKTTKNNFIYVFFIYREDPFFNCVWANTRFLKPFTCAEGQTSKGCIITPYNVIIICKWLVLFGSIFITNKKWEKLTWLFCQYVALKERPIIS